MRVNNRLLTTLALVFSVASVIACKNREVKAQAIIKIDGSSTVFPITEAVSEEFQNSKKNQVKVTVGISGTGGGFKKFCRGETDVQDASRPILAQEIEACKAQGIQFFEIPVAFDALTVMVHPSNPLSAITVAQLKKMWAPEAQGQVMQWNQVETSWPSNPLKLYGAGADSGTFDYFTEAIVGKAKATRGDYTASEDDNVLVQGIANDKNALGYFGYAYYVENQGKLKALAIDNGKGGVLPSPQTVENGTYQPLSRPIFIYINQKSAQKPEVKEFVEFYLQHASSLVKQVKYIALPDQAYTMALDNFRKGKVGSVFAGHSEVGLPIGELLKREAK